MVEVAGNSMHVAGFDFFDNQLAWCMSVRLIIQKVLADISCPGLPDSLYIWRLPTAP
jgi:hypothetical protein